MWIDLLWLTPGRRGRAQAKADVERAVDSCRSTACKLLYCPLQELTDLARAFPILRTRNAGAQEVRREESAVTLRCTARKLPMVLMETGKR
jgi:hypothetical protein